MNVVLIALNVIVLLFNVNMYGCHKPNILLIIADDMGWNDVGFHSGDVETPNIDALAYQGVILNRHYAQPVCSPSRAALLTGEYPMRHGIQGGPFLAGHPDGLPLNVKIMPQYFSALGYKTHLLGKWHLGYATQEHLPTRRGFHSFFGYLNGYLGYWDCIHLSQGVAGRDWRRNEEGAWRECYGRYLTDLLTEEAVKVIHDHPREDGLLLVLAHAAVHTTELDIAREAPPGVTNVTDRGYLRAMAERLDRSVGKVIHALNRKGLLNNSIVVFISDNGAPTKMINFANAGSNWPLRGEKKSLHEGGVRTVAAVWSPLLRNLSRVTDQYFHISDWLPTLYAAAGGSPEDLECKDGINQWPSLKTPNLHPRDTILINVNERDGTEAVIKNDWKLVKNHNLKDKLSKADLYYGESGRWMPYDVEKVKNSVVAQVLGPIPEKYEELRRAATIQTRCTEERAAMAEDCHNDYCLFDIINDPTECYNLASNHTDVVAELKSIIASYRENLILSKSTLFDMRANPMNWDDYWSPWIK